MAGFKTFGRLAMATIFSISAGVASAQEGQVVTQDAGGTFGNALRRIMYDPFTQETGIRVLTVQEVRGGPRVKAQVDAGKTEWDVTFIFDQETRQLADCCLSKLDYSKLSPEAQKVVETLPKTAVRDNAVALQQIGVLMAYNKEKYADKAPKDWADFWNVKDFPGNRCLPGWPRFVFEAALLADGVPRDKLYPIDMDRALKKIAEIKPHVVKWWNTNVQAPQLLLDGEADMCMAYSGRIGTLLRDSPDAPVAKTWQDAFIYYDFFAIPKNAPDYDNALKLISYRMDPKRAAELAAVANVPLPSPLVYEAGDPAVRDNWPNSPEAREKGVEWNADYWGAKSPDGRTNEEYAQEKLNELLAQ